MYRRPEGFTAFGIVDRQWFTQEWRSKLQMPSREKNELDVSIREIVEKLQGSVDYGQVLWLEMAFDLVAEDFFSWFLADFWKPLTRDSGLIEKGITVVGILTLEDTLSDPALFNPFRYTPDNFNVEQYCEIELANWGQKDIETWIIRYMNPTLRQRRLPPEQKPQSLSARIYNRSHQGEPLSAHDFIRGTLLDEIFQSFGAI